MYKDLIFFFWGPLNVKCKNFSSIYIFTKQYLKLYFYLLTINNGHFISIVSCEHGIKTGKISRWKENLLHDSGLTSFSEIMWICHTIFIFVSCHNNQVFLNFETIIEDKRNEFFAIIIVFSKCIFQFSWNCYNYLSRV